MDHGQFALPVPFSSSSHTPTHPGTLTHTSSPLPRTCCSLPSLTYRSVTPPPKSCSQNQSYCTDIPMTSTKQAWITLAWEWEWWMEDCGKGLLWIPVHVLLPVPRGDGFLKNLCVFGRKISSLNMTEICLTYKHNVCFFCKTPYHHDHVSVSPAICLTAIYALSVPLPTAPLSVLSISQAPKEQTVESDFTSLYTWPVSMSLYHTVWCHAAQCEYSSTKCQS